MWPATADAFRPVAGHADGRPIESAAAFLRFTVWEHGLQQFGELGIQHQPRN